MNRIRIGELNNQCHLLGAQEDIAFLGSELRQLSSADLPAAIAEEVAHRLPSLLSRSGIYRIKRLRLNLSLTRRELGTRHLSALLAEQLVEQLEERLQQSGDDVAYFASHIEFIAQMIRDLLLREGKNLWMYEDYPALRHLPAEEAVVQLLMPRFDQLAGLASALQQRNVLQVLLRVMSPDQAARLWRQWTGETVTALFRLEAAPSAAELASLHSWLQQSSLRAIDSDMPLVLATLHHLLECLAARECQVPLRTALWGAAQQVFISRHRGLVAEVLSTSADPESADGALSSTSSESADTELQRVLQDLRRWAGAASEHRDYLLRMSRQLREKEVVGSQPVTDGSEPRPAAEEKMIFSSRAGLVLLLPVVFSLRLHSCYTMADLRSAIWVAGTEEGEAEDSEEAWLKELLPDDQHSLPTGMLPTGWQLGLSVERQARIGELQASGAVVQMLAQLLLAQFAARLSGLQRSSDAYLRNQFLRRSGYFIIDKAQTIARLDTIPLFIVLNMSGLAGWHGELPWSKRSLTIEIAS